jgi:hypothetical protein
VPSLAKKSVPEESVYEKEELIKNAELVFKVKPEVVVGALHGNKNKKLTISETKEAIKAFKEKKVK